MSTQHNPNQLFVQHLRPVRCLRHHVSMAACDDCRAARSAQVRREKQTRAAS